MKIMSFARTVPALLAGVKKVSRRDWKFGYAMSFHQGELVQAWDNLPRAHGHRVGTIRVTMKPYQEWAEDIPIADFWAEGLAYMQQLGYPDASRIWSDWHRDNPLLWVVRLELVEVTAR